MKNNISQDVAVNWQATKELDEMKKKRTQEQPKWINLMNVKNDRTPKTNSVHNVIALLNYDRTFQDKFRFNEFTQEIETVKEIDFLVDDNVPAIIPKGKLEDDSYSAIIAYFDRYYDLCFSDNIFSHAILVIAQSRRYNPVKDYMADAYRNWDGVKRYQTILSDFLGAENNEINGKIIKMFFTGAVAKVYDPWTKFDYVLDLIGSQGVGKTTFLEKIAPLGYYTDQFTNFNDKDNYAVMLRNLIVNDDEMTATDESKFSEIKKFATMQEIEYRPPYAHTSKRRPKGFVLTRTSNNLTYLKDKTGNRRFLPIRCGVNPPIKNVIHDLTPQLVKQFWGEMVNYFKKGFELTFSKTDMNLLEKHREDFQYHDPLEDKLNNYLQKQIKDNVKFLSTEQICKELEINMNFGKTAKKIKYFMENNEDWKYTKNKGKRGYRLTKFVI